MNTVASHNRYLLLDNVIGWRTLTSTGLTLSRPDGYYSIDALPGAAQLLLPEAGTAPSTTCGVASQVIECPTSLAQASGRLYVVDGARHVVVRLSTAGAQPEMLSGVGGYGQEPRRLNAPRGIAVLPSRAIVVADTGNHRVQVFSAAPHALLALWGRANAQPGDGCKEFRWPWGVATDATGNIYVADRGNRRVQVIRQDGRSLSHLGADFLVDPTEIAVAPDGTLAVVDAASDPKRNIIFLFPPGGAVSRTLESDAPRSVAFDPDGNLFVGNATGIIYKFEPDRKSPGGFRVEGAGTTGIEGPVQQLLWIKGTGLLAIIRETENQNRQRIWTMDPEGAHAPSGVLTTLWIDSRIENCSWHRVQLQADVPEGTSLQVDSLTFEPADGVTSPPSLDPLTDFSGGARCLLSGDSNPDCLVQSRPGRYLALRITMRSDGRKTPLLKSLKVYFPRESYLQYLPAVYQQDDDSRQFLERFLSIFQTSFDAFDHRIDSIAQLFDPFGVPEKYFSWLAAWLALQIDPAWTLAKRRDMLKHAIQAYQKRGTPAGLVQAIQDYAGIDARILEHFRLRQWPALCFAIELNRSGIPLWSRDFYGQLQVRDYSRVGYFRLAGQPEPALEPVTYGAHQFSVFFQADPYTSQDAESKVRRVVDSEKPAHTQAILCPIFPRMRVGVQATLGIDTVVGQVSYLVLNRLATLGYDSILACSAPEHDIGRLGATTRPRAGINARLL